jgi:predicted ArsR family transcriptional regulator
VLGQLAEEIARQDGAERARELLGAVGRRLGSGVSSGDLASRVAAGAEALRSLGGDVLVSGGGEQWQLQGFGCPLAQVTGAHPEVCELARALLEEITGEPVVECCDRSERPRCGFRIGPA